MDIIYYEKKSKYFKYMGRPKTTSIWGSLSISSYKVKIVHLYV